MAGPPTRALPDQAAPPAPSSIQPSPAAPLTGLAKRAEFRACARGSSAHTPGMVVQARGRAGDGDAIRFGLTASRKVGKAVQRNRARRRLREAARRVLPVRGRPGWDYVLIARRETTVARPFARLMADLERALERLHGTPGP